MAGEIAPHLVFTGLPKPRGVGRPKLFRVKDHRGGTEGNGGVIGAIHHWAATARSVTEHQRLR
jgi:hypothetical protein